MKDIRERAKSLFQLMPEKCFMPNCQLCGHAVRLIESFAREIRNETLEEARNICIARGNIFQGADIGTWEEAELAYSLGDKIRALKDTTTLAVVTKED